MAMDNIQKSILTVLGISGLVAFVMPASQNTATPANNAGDGNIETLQPPAPLPPPPPLPEQNYTSEEPIYGNEESDASAFGQPTISGLPYGQQPNSPQSNDRQSGQGTQNNQSSQSSQQSIGSDPLYPQSSPSQTSSYDGNSPAN